MDKMRKLSIIWGIILVIIFSLLIFLGFVWKEKVEVYKKVEDELQSLVMKYKDAATLGNEEVKVELKELIEIGIVEKLSKEYAY